MKLDINSAIVKAYLDEVSKNIIYGRATKKRIIKEFRNMVEDYVRNSPNCELADLYVEFGVPSEISLDFANKQEYRDLVKRAKRKARTLIILCVALSVIVMAVAITAIVMVFQYGGDVEVSNSYR